MSTEAKHQETHGFQTEARQILHLMTHSLYSNKEIFLRELVSNASDAADKLRFQALDNDSLYEDQPNLCVRLGFDKEARTLTITDNGVGMSRDDVIAHLGTIAKSGTAEFLSQLSGDQARDSRLIGQFGVGFYSAFIVADKVVVRSRLAGEDPENGVEWSSAGEGEYTVADIEKAERGTEITLHLREGEDEFLDDWRLRSIITKYSDHIGIPVEMYKEGTEEQEGPEGDKIPATEGGWEAINKATALWTRTKSELSDEDYKEFYKHVSHDFDEPLAWAHNRVEGKLEYTTLLYIPKTAPWDLYNRDQKHGLKLYVQRVFIMDDAEQFMPTYLRFVRGLIDSNDLPLNISREILQDNKVTESLRNAATKRVLTMLERMAKNDAEKYQSFWEQFGMVMKEGPAEDQANKALVAKLLRFATTEQDTAAQTVGLETYVERMKEGQEKIYYIVADSFEAAKNSPHLELLRKKGIEVLLLSDRIDEWLMSHLTEFDGKSFQSVTQGDLGLGELEDEEDKKEQEKAKEEFASFVERVKENLGDQVKDVRLSHRLTNSPSCIVADEHDMSSQMAKLMQSMGQQVPETKPIFELNPEHAMVKRVADEADEERFGRWISVLYDQALLAERGSLKDPSGFVSRLNELLLELAR